MRRCTRRSRRKRGDELEGRKEEPECGRDGDDESLRLLRSWSQMVDSELDPSSGTKVAEREEAKVGEREVVVCAGARPQCLD